MHLLVLSAFRHDGGFLPIMSPSRSQCTFWCSVLSDPRALPGRDDPLEVSMHLLVLSAFRRLQFATAIMVKGDLNAPFGAQCFPTLKGQAVDTLLKMSQCTFWCSVLSD